MENQEIKLEDKIIISKGGKEFIFPAYAIDTQEKIEAKIVEYAEQLKVAESKSDLEGLKKAKKMLELLTTQKFSTNIGDCQAYYLEHGFTTEPTRSPEEREEAKAGRNR